MKGRFATTLPDSIGLGDDALLEREAELALLSDAVARARGGAGSVIVFDGPPGVGKSRLAERCRELAEAEDMGVLTAHGRELESEFSFGVVLQLFEVRLVGAPSEERERLLSGAARLAAPLLADGPRNPLPDGQAFSLLHGLYRLCANLAADRPLLILVDDAHWADEPSLRFLLYLAQRLEGVPLVMLLTQRHSRTAPELLAQIVEHPATTPVRIGPLSESAVASWLRGTFFRGAHSRFCRACYDVTGGNPFLLRELASELISQDIEPKWKSVKRVTELAPRSVAEATLVRLRRLGPGAAELAQALAVVGDDAQLRHCAAIAGLEQSEAARLADELAAAGVLRGSGQLAFVHPIVRRAIYEQLPSAERAEAHLQLAQTLAGEGGPGELVAAHLLQSNPAGEAWVVEALTAAAAQALARGAPEPAVRYLRRALDEPPQPEKRAQVMLELGRAEATAGEGEAVDRLSAAVQLIEDPRERALTSLDLGRALFAQGRQRDAAEAFRWGATEAGDLDRRLQLQLRTSHTLVARIGGLSAEQLDETAPPAAPDELQAGKTATGLVLLANMALEGALRGSPRQEVMEVARAALGRGVLLEHETSDGLGYYFAAAALAIAEDLQGAEVALAIAVEDAHSRGSVLGYATASYFRSWTMLCRGRIGDAAAKAQNALAAERYGWRMGLAGAHAILANTLEERGDRRAAWRELDRGAAAAETSGELPLPFLLASRAALFVRSGQPREALATYLECSQRLDAAGAVNPACIPWRSGAALAHGQLGDLDEAKRLIEEELELARSFGAPGPIGRALYAHGTLLNGGGVELLRQSVEVLRESEAKLDLARALVALGTALRHTSKLREARAPLREGLDLAERCGAKALAEQARAEALAAGIRPRRTALRGVEALTPRELQVATLAAEGRSNREIAEALFVTLKTVEWHLKHSYEKLEIRSRDELRAKLSGGLRES